MRMEKGALLGVQFPDSSFWKNRNLNLKTQLSVMVMGDPKIATYCKQLRLRMKRESIHTSIVSLHTKNLPSSPTTIPERNGFQNRCNFCITFRKTLQPIITTLFSSIPQSHSQIPSPTRQYLSTPPYSQSW